MVNMLGDPTINSNLPAIITLGYGGYYVNYDKFS